MLLRFFALIGYGEQVAMCCRLNQVWRPYCRGLSPKSNITIRVLCFCRVKRVLCFGDHVVALIERAGGQSVRVGSRLARTFTMSACLWLLV